MNTGEIVFMKYEHPRVKDEKYFSLAVSPEHGIYAVCYQHHDLITVCDFDGHLKYNIYGPKWNGSQSDRISYFNGAFFYGDQLFTAYIGENTFVDKGKGVETSRPTRFIVFDINGNYLRTLETEYSIWDYSCDRENNRIILSLDDEIQFACLELDGLME
jgi:hypothetical protein